MRWLIPLVYVGILCIAFVFVSTSLINLVSEYLFSQKIREEQRQTVDYAAEAVAAAEALNADSLYEVALRLAGQGGGRVMILSNNGVVLADSSSLYNGRRLAVREVAETLVTGESSYGFYDLSDASRSQRYRNLLGVYTAPIRSGGTMAGILLYTSDAAEVNENLSQMRQRIVLWIGLVIIAVGLLSIFVSRIFTKPIQELSDGIARMTNGDLHTQVRVKSATEFGQLADAFNSMSQRLEALDQTRNQFVSNASHELKTPLSAIKIMVETLQMQDPPDPAIEKEFLSDINSEIDRLNAIVGDLLTLVHFDSGKVDLKLEKIRLDQLIVETARRLKPLADARHITLTTNILDGIDLTADSSKLQQVFYNLIDNAIKYTPEGGSVTVDLERVGHNAIAHITDTGIGIPKAAQVHIFDRFYRVDKARARATGGTGLGLSIVRDIVRLHGGSVSVTSEEDKGSTFMVDLPIVSIVV